MQQIRGLFQGLPYLYGYSSHHVPGLLVTKEELFSKLKGRKHCIHGLHMKRMQ